MDIDFGWASWVGHTDKEEMGSAFQKLWTSNTYAFMKVNYNNEYVCIVKRMYVVLITMFLNQVKLLANQGNQKNGIYKGYGGFVKIAYFSTNHDLFIIITI